MGEGDLDGALEIFRLNTEYFPDAFNTWDSLAEAYMNKGESELAIEYYRKSLELNPDNQNARRMIERIRSKS
jgi:tetratricopeptide (TPR) repeat protein